MDQQETNRRDFLRAGALGAGGLFAAGGRQAQADEKPAQHQHEEHGGSVGGPNDRGKLAAGQRKLGDAPAPIETPDLPKLKFEINDGVKEFHLTAGHLKREFLPGQWFDVWGYNGSMPGPTIEAVEGDRVRIMVHNNLPEATSMHWHGLEVPIAMDGVPGLTQDPIPPGGMFTYEFTLRQNGTYFYHSHGAMQEGIGMVGLFIIHPKSAFQPAVDRDFGLIIQEWAILPGATVPNTMSMEFNLFTLNGRAAPYVTPMVVRQGDRVRIRLVNFSSIDHHPMHLHGLTFWVTGNEAGRIPESAWVPHNTVLIGVAQAADIEFVANNPGDWMLHCHMFHHMMNFMSSMVGQMGGHTRKGMEAGGNMGTGMGMLTRGPALSEDNGAKLGRGTGEQTGNERAVGNGSMEGMKGMDMKGQGMKGMDMKGMDMKGQDMKGMDMKGQDMKGMDMKGQDMKGQDMKGMDMKGDKEKQRVPGYPQDMFGMTEFSAAELKKLNKPETRGMRRDWFKGVEGLMSVVRVLPPELYDKVVSGKGEVEPGASVPGASSGSGQEHKH